VAWFRGKPHPNAVKPQSVYALEGSRENDVVFVVAPGPSLDDFPHDELQKYTTIGVNSAIEVVKCSYFCAYEGTLFKRFYSLYTGDRIDRIITDWSRSFIAPLLPAGKELYCYKYLDLSVLRMKTDVDFHPFWRRPEEHFLPGRSSITANALSLAVLMRPRLIVTVGLDLAMTAEKYYASGVKINPGPRLRRRALHAGQAWMWLASRKGVWRGPEIVTTSPTLKLKGVKRVNVAEALKKANEVHESAEKNRRDTQTVR
jgi:hypothetical protein